MREALLVIDKKPGPSSFDVVRKFKRVLPRKTKIGHTGSLDPFASGVLILMLGRATKLSGVLLNADKSYRAVMKLGVATDSMDQTGQVTEEKPIPEGITEAKVRETLSEFEGVWHQTPPMYSAKKVKGVRLYQLARQKIEVERKPIPVDLFRVELIKLDLPWIHFEVDCSKGTYVRSLAEEIGRRLGTVAHLHELRRLSCGRFSLDQSVEVEEVLADFDGWLEKGHETFRRFLFQERHLQKTPMNGNRVLH